MPDSPGSPPYGENYLEYERRGTVWRRGAADRAPDLDPLRRSPLTLQIQIPLLMSPGGLAGES